MRSLGETGARVSSVTGQHSDHPSSAILAQSGGCWVSTGCFPQVITVSLARPATLHHISLQSYNGGPEIGCLKDICIYSSSPN